MAHERHMLLFTSHLQRASDVSCRCEEGDVMVCGGERESGGGGAEGNCSVCTCLAAPTFSLILSLSLFHTSVPNEAISSPKPLSNRPAASLLTNSLCQALPQAAPCNYSQMQQTGEMGVCCTLHAELRKTTTVGPLFVNQTQGQYKMMSARRQVLVIVIEDCQVKEQFY